MKNPHRSLIAHRCRSAFTLVEMLVVIAIMSILMTAGAIGLGGMDGKGVTSGVATVEALVNEARGLAVSQGTESRLLVAQTLTSTPADNLRKIVIVTRTRKADGSPEETERWQLASRGVTLPDQTFFSVRFSKKNHTGTPTALETMSLNGADIKQLFRGNYYYYEFNAQGLPKDPGSSFVIATGARPSVMPQPPPRLTAAGKRDFGGFVIWRNGNTSIFRSPEQISPAISMMDAGQQF
ncbi:MAG: prepilin-type N-terminal cleavage/methylation domain-containing protein [Verrucomicrobia bacterium]|nr:MAG: prepilin-type N-terminal cleavage/methylation domain-containing protein [Verrucomicrobiota bacterium]